MAKSLTLRLAKSANFSTNTKEQKEKMEEKIEMLDGMLQQNNLNAEIVGLIAEEVMKKHEFYQMMKTSYQDKQRMIHKSKLKIIYEEQDANKA